MIIQIALIISVILQFGAFFIVLSLIPRTKFNISWIAISIGFFLMAIRRSIEFLDINTSDEITNQILVSSWIAVLISLLMFVASFYIRQIFNLQSRLNKLRNENESKVLSAIIKTEEKERKRFAKELHDGLGPILSSIKMAISAVDRSIVGKKNEEIINKTESNVDNAIISTKEISNQLNPHILDRFGLEKAIKTITDTIITKKPFDFIIQSNLKGKRYNYNLEVVLYRILCELINNTLKHASASKIEISLYGNENNMELYYEDNGIGFDTNDSFEGMGLLNINSRVKSLHGEINIKSKHNNGFFLRITLPV